MTMNPESSLWDLTALMNAADPKAPAPARQLWLSRCLEWLRHTPRGRSAEPEGSPWPVRRLRLLLNALAQDPDLQARVRGTVQAAWAQADLPGLLAEFGFAERPTLGGELLARIHARVLPASPDTPDGPTLFALWCRASDARWLSALDAPLRERLLQLIGPADGDDASQRTEAAVLQALVLLASTLQAAGLSRRLRARLPGGEGQPLAGLLDDVAALRAARQGGEERTIAQAAMNLHARIAACEEAVDAVRQHHDAQGVSVALVHQQVLARRRLGRMRLLLDLLLTEGEERAAAWQHLAVTYCSELESRRGLRALLAEHYGLLARVVAERHAETGEHYITRDRHEYRDMLQRAAGGGAVIAGTTALKFMIGALSLGAFWGGFYAGLNYAASFVLVMLLHWTVATKQPAMTAPALAAALPTSPNAPPEDFNGFIDKVAQLVRSQVAGIVGNVLACAPLVVLGAWLWGLVAGAPALSPATSQYVLHSLTLLGPTAAFAAFTGVLLFASSLVAGWAENAFVLHRLEGALAWNPRIVAVLGAPRAQRWAAWWRANVSGVAANVSLGLMLGLVPPVLGFFGLPIEVRHVTLASGQLAAAATSMGPAVMATAAFWWCVIGIAAVGVLNVGVSFALAFRVALKARGIRVADRRTLSAALLARLRARPLDFLRPPPEDSAAR